MLNIELKDIKEFSKTYNANPENKKIEARILKQGLEKSCINQKIVEENPFFFNIELSETKRYDQKESLRCWIFSGFNMIKRNMAENLNMDIMKFELSDNYIAFFHRLEKANTAYETVIHSRTTDLTKIEKKKILKNPVSETGNWKLFINIVKKYGMVPLEVMPSSIEGENCQNIENLYTETIRKNLKELVELKKQGKPNQELRKVKKRMLAENYEFLSKVYGEPKQIFNYNYIDKNGNSVKLKNITPLEFVQQFLTLDIDNYVFISNSPHWNSKYGQKFRNPYAVNERRKKGTDYLHITSKELKKLAIQQLKDNIPVVVGIFIRKFTDKKLGILDTRLYDYEKSISYKRLNKEDGMSFGDIELHHWMTITGVYLENNESKRWKVEDSYGDKEKVNGYYVMNDNYFTDYVFTVIIHKKYLSKKQLELYNQKAIIEK